MAERFDISTLRWLKGEIDETLEHARVGLITYIEEGQDENQIGFCVSYLHQVRGSLQLVELNGATQLASEMEATARALEQKQISQAETAVEILMRAFLQLPDYLEALHDGMPDNSVILLPIINELRQIRGASSVSEAALFSPDLTAEPPAATAAMADLRPVAAKARGFYQTHLVKLLQDKEVEAGLKAIGSVFEKLIAVSEPVEYRRWLWAMAGLIEGVRQGGIAYGKEIKQLLGRGEQVLKQVASGGPDALSPDLLVTLTRSALFYVAGARTDGPRTRELKTAFNLESLRPSGEVIDQARSRLGGFNTSLKQTVAADLMEELTRIKETLDIVSRRRDHAVDELNKLVAGLSAVASTVEILQQHVLADALKGQVAAIQRLISTSATVEERELMEIAEVVLAVESALADWGTGSLADGDSENGDEGPADAEHRRVVRQVMKEAKSDLIGVKEGINRYLAAPDDKAPLREVGEPMQRLIGSMGIVGYGRVAQILRACNFFLSERMLEASTVPADDQLDLLADALTSIEYYFEAFVESRVHPASALEVAERSVATLGYPVNDLPNPAPLSEEEPEEEAEGEMALESAEPEAELVAPARAEPAAPAVTVPSAPVAQAAPVVHVPPEEDEEIIEIFTEEAQEQFAAMAELFPKWRASTSDGETLKELRRCFHTLKGSGRLVGARDLGEFAWAFESLLNRVIDGTIAPSPLVLDLIDHSRPLFDELLTGFRAHTAPDPYVLTIQELAQTLARPDAPAGLQIPVRGAAPCEPEPAVEPSAVEPEAAAAAESQPVEEEAPAVPAMDPVLLEIYSNECFGHLATIAEFVARCRKQGGRCGVENELIRALHTLRGASRTANVPPVATLSGVLEDYAKLLQNEELPLPDAAVDLLDEVVTTVHAVIAELSQPGVAVTSLVALTERAEQISRTPAVPAPEPAPVSPPDEVQALDGQPAPLAVQDAALEGLLAQDLAADFAEDLEPDLALDLEAELGAALESELDAGIDLGSSAGIGALDLTEPEQQPVAEAESEGTAGLELDLAAALESDFASESELAIDSEPEPVATLEPEPVVGAELEALAEPLIEIDADFGAGLELELADDLAPPSEPELVSELDRDLAVPDPEPTPALTADLPAQPAIGFGPDADLGLELELVPAPQIADGAPTETFDEVLELSGLGLALDLEQEVLESVSAPAAELLPDAYATPEADLIAGLESELQALEGEAEPVPAPVSDEDLALDALLREEPASTNLELSGQAYESLLLEDDAELELLTSVPAAAEPSAFSLQDLEAALDDSASEELTELELAAAATALEETADLAEAGLLEPALAAVEPGIPAALESEFAFEGEETIEAQELAALEALLAEEPFGELEDDAPAVVPHVPVAAAVPAPPIQPPHAAAPAAPAGHVAEALDPELLELFLEEAGEILDATEVQLHGWRRNLADRSILDALQRLLHTLKGGARVASISPIADLSHEVESLLTRVVDGLTPATPEMVALLERTADRLVRMVEALRSGAPLPDGQDLETALRAMAAGQAPALQAPVVAQPPAAAAPKPIPKPEPAPVAEHYDSDLLEIFLEEATEILDSAEVQLQAWKQQPGERAVIEVLQRLLHTLKGGARMAGVTAIGDLSHEVESLLTRVVDGHVAVSQGLIGLLQVTADRLSQMLDHLKRGVALPQGADLLENLRAVSSGGPLVIPAPEAELEAEPASLEEVEASEVEAPAPVVPAAVAEPEAPMAAPVAAAVAERAIEPLESERRHGSRVRQEMVRVRSDLFDELVNLAGEASIYRSRIGQQIGEFRGNFGELEETVDRLREQMRQLDIEAEAQIQSRYQETGSDAEFDPLEFDRFTRMQQLSRSISESLNDLMSLRAMMQGLVREAETLLLQQSRVNTELQEGLMQARMVPLVDHAPRLRRVVRQACADLGRQAELHFRGAEVELDRSVLERMLAPLEHLLRNAVAHGIEEPAARRAAGKSDGGEVVIALAREGGEIVIRVNDDGRGIDLSIVRRKAIERGLLSAHTELSDRDVMQFILEAGFSTAAVLTQVAGRGVGMDVVNSEVKQLGGSLEIDSVPGKGTTFTIRLPLTLAVSRALLVHSSEEIFAIPLLSIQGIVRVSQEELAVFRQQQPPTFNWVEQDYNLLPLAQLVGGVPVPPPDGAKRPLVLAQTGEHRVALEVDGIIGSREVVVKSLGPQLAQLHGLSGATILGDGTVAMILDLPNLIRQGLARPHLFQAAVEPEKEPQQPTVMVVDDSITVRRVTQRLLERNQLLSLTAKDGVEALSVLEEHMPDVILLDIEMPRMDGFELATHIRNNERLRHIPMVMITSRTGDKHRQRALDIGVDRYLGKPYQEADLLETIRSLLGTRHGEGPRAATG